MASSNSDVVTGSDSDAVAGGTRLRSTRRSPAAGSESPPQDPSPRRRIRVPAATSRAAAEQGELTELR